MYHCHVIASCVRGIFQQYYFCMYTTKHTVKFFVCPYLGQQKCGNGNGNGKGRLKRKSNFVYYSAVVLLSTQYGLFHNIFRLISQYKQECCCDQKIVECCTQGCYCELVTKIVYDNFQDILVPESFTVH